MQSLDKIRPADFNFPATRRKSFEQIKTMFRRFIPYVLKTILSGVILSGFHIFLVGAADRFGISPKWSVIVSGLFLSAICGGLAICGTAKANIAVNEFSHDQNAEPLCKILMMRRKRTE